MFFKGLLFLTGVIICIRLPVLPHFWFSIWLGAGCLPGLEIPLVQNPWLGRRRLSLDAV